MGIGLPDLAECKQVGGIDSTARFFYNCMFYSAPYTVRVCAERRVQEATNRSYETLSGGLKDSLQTTSVPLRPIADLSVVTMQNSRNMGQTDSWYMAYLYT